MFFAEVTPLMHNGRRLKPNERAAPMRVTVTILESDRDRNNFRRNIVEASLYVSYGISQMASRGRLVDPVILPHAGPGFLLSGIELEATDAGQTISEHRQVWLVVPVERQGTE